LPPKPQGCGKKSLLSFWNAEFPSKMPALNSFEKDPTALYLFVLEKASKQILDPHERQPLAN